MRWRPSITAQPSALSVITGQTATFSVVASGTAPLTYQWRKNGTAIPAVRRLPVTRRLQLRAPITGHYLALC